VGSEELIDEKLSSLRFSWVFSNKWDKWLNSRWVRILSLL